jgi:carboxymethylenebutenolidase
LPTAPVDSPIGHPKLAAGALALALVTFLALPGCNRGHAQQETGQEAGSDHATQPGPPGSSQESAQESPMSDDDYVDRMAQEHRDDQPTPSPAADSQPSAAVRGESVVYATIEGQPVTGYLSRPAAVEGSGSPGSSGSLPAVIVIHEWWGLNDNIRSMADQLAGEGYLALAVDLYRGQVAEEPEAARAIMQSAMENRALVEENLRQAIAYLHESNPDAPIGVVGWCFGGGWSLQTALLAPDQIAAAVIYYGRVVTEPEQLATLDMPILGHFGGADEGIPLEGVRQFESTLQDLGKPVEIHVYEGAGHAFANPSGHNYQAEAAETSWTRTLAFLHNHLQ